MSCRRDMIDGFKQCTGIISPGDMLDCVEQPHERAADKTCCHARQYRDQPKAKRPSALGRRNLQVRLRRLIGNRVIQ